MQAFAAERCVEWGVAPVQVLPSLLAGRHPMLILAGRHAVVFSGGGSMPKAMHWRPHLAAACLLIWLAGLRPSYAQPVPDRQAIHVLNRLAFGPTLEEFRHIQAIGVDRYIAEQLSPEAI